MPDWLSGTLSGVSLLAAVGILARLMYWGGRVDSDRENFKEFMKEVRGDIKTLLKRSSPVRGSASPIHLTDLGKSVSEDIGGAAWARRLADEVASKTEDMDAYGIQGFADGYADAVEMSDEEYQVVRQGCIQARFGGK